jgi:hypothetical protein
VAGFAQDYAAYALLRRQEWLPGGLVMGWLGSWPWYIAFGLIITFLLLLFPDGRLPSRRWRPVAWAAGVDIAVLTVWAAFAPRPFEGPPGMPMPQNPWGIERAAGLFQLLSAIAGMALLALTVLSLASLVLRFRRSRGEQRQQLKWFTYAALLTVGAWLGATGLHLRLTGPLLLLSTILSFWLVAAAIGVAILRYHLYDIDRLINRTLVYALLTCCSAPSTPARCWSLGSCSAGWPGTPRAGRWPAPPWPSRRCSSRPVAAFSRWWIGVSIGVATTRPRRSRRSAFGSATRSTWTRCRPSCWPWSTRRCSRQGRRCGSDHRLTLQRVVKGEDVSPNRHGVTPCMPYTDQRPHDGQFSCRAAVPTIRW